MKKVSLALAVACVLVWSAFAQADTILFPWVVKDSAISTVISLVNTFDPDDTDLDCSNVRFHLIYLYKKSTANEQLEKCDEFDFCEPTSFNDILVFDAAANFNNGAPLFGDTGGGSVTYDTVQANDSLALPVDGPRRAFLLVNNECYTSEHCGGGNDTPDGTLYGEAMVVDISNGAAWGYRAYNPYDEDLWLNFFDNEVDPADLPQDAYGEVLDGQDEITRLVIQPPNVFTTKIFVTPIAPNDSCVDDGTSVNQWRGDLIVSSSLYCDDNTTFTGLFDMDENCISFDKKKTVVCTDASTLDHYVSNGAWLTFVNTGGPGWAWFATSAPGGKESCTYTIDMPPVASFKATNQATVGKLEYNIGVTQFDGNSVEDGHN